MNDQQNILPILFFFSNRDKKLEGWLDAFPKIRRLEKKKREAKGEGDAVLRWWKLDDK